MDVTAALAGPSINRKTAKSTSKKAKSSKDGSKDGFRRSPEDDASGDDDADFIHSLLDKQKMKEGAKVVKGRKDLKGKQGTVGGGSFQSMGASFIPLKKSSAHAEYRLQDSPPVCSSPYWSGDLSHLHPSNALLFLQFFRLLPAI
jgi:hypothetical protein